jgi:hypothetical protein
VKDGGPKNIVASVQARLVERSRALGVEHQLHPRSIRRRAPPVSPVAVRVRRPVHSQGRGSAADVARRADPTDEGRGSPRFR